EQAARALEVNPNVLHRWRREFRQGPGNVFPGNGKQRWSEGRIAELERKGLQSEKETAVVHDRNFAVETNRRTMNFQRAAECVLTGCLSPGGRFRFTRSTCPSQYRRQCPDGRSGVCAHLPSEVS